MRIRKMNSKCMLCHSQLRLHVDVCAFFLFFFFFFSHSQLCLPPFFGVHKCVCLSFCVVKPFILFVFKNLRNGRCSTAIFPIHLNSPGLLSPQEVVNEDVDGGPSLHMCDWYGL